MKIISFMEYNILPNNNTTKKKVRAFIVSDTVPSGFPTSDSAITEAFPEYIFDTMSILYIFDENAANHYYAVKEDGTWQAISSDSDGEIIVRALGVSF